MTMLQRSPTYIVSMPAEDPIANAAAPRCSATRRAYAVARWKNVAIATLRLPAQPAPPDARCASCCARGVARAAARRATTSTRTSRRATTRGTSACASCPTATCSRRSAHGQASVVTDHIERSPSAASGCASGARARGRHRRHRDRPEPARVRRHRARRRRRAGRRCPERMAYKGMMLSGVPNFAFAIGYTNASWTLKADLVAEYVCRAARPHGRARLRRVRAGRRRPVGRARARCSTSTPATSSARSHLFPKRRLARAVAARDELRAGRRHAPPRRARGRRAALQRALSSQSSASGQACRIEMCPSCGRSHSSGRGSARSSA